MSAWGRLALIHAAFQGEEVLTRFASQFCYELKPEFRDEVLRPDSVDVGVGMSVAMDSLPVPPPEIPSAYFVAVQSKTVFRKNTETPPELRSGTSLTIDNTKGTFIFDGPSPLMPSSRYLPLLQNVLGYLAKTQRMDSKNVVSNLAHGKTLSSIPRHLKQRWPSHLLLVVDTGVEMEPYWADFRDIVKALQTLLGDYSVQVIAFDESSLNTDWCRYQTWPPGPVCDFEYGNPFTGKDAVLILSDQGASKSSGSAMERHKLSHQIQKMLNPSSVVLTFSPCPFKANSTVPYPKLNLCYFVDKVRMPRKLQKKPKFKAMESRFSNKILALFSYLPLFDAGLLRKVRLALDLGSSEVEAYVWNHKHVEAVQFGRRVRTDCVGEYQDKYQFWFKGRERAKCFWRLVRSHHITGYKGLKQLEKLLRFEAEPPTNDKEKKQQLQAFTYFQSLTNTAFQKALPSRQALIADQCKAVYHALPNNFSNQPLAAHLAVMGYRDQIGPDRWPEALPTALRAEVQWAIKGSLNKVKWHIQYDSSLGKIKFSKVNTSQNKILALLEAEEEIPPRMVIEAERYSSKTFPNYFSSDAFEWELPKNSFFEFESSIEKLRLHSQTRPPWAAKKGYREGKLFATVRHFSDTQRAYWEPETENTEGIQTWGWHWPEPIKNIAEDDFGFYADINLMGYIQRFRWIPKGSFMMGSPEDEVGRRSDEKLHDVTLTQGFWLADIPVCSSLSQYVNAKKDPIQREWENTPLDRVSRHAAQRFIQNLNLKVKGLQARLPTEAEWEYACRAGSKTAYSWGEKASKKQANYTSQKPVDVKTYSANAWGLYQMHGNVWEWCNDWLGEYSSTSVVDPEGPKNGVEHVLRGGSWYFSELDMRSACRSAGPEHTQFRQHAEGGELGVGFRLALGCKLESSS